MQVPTYLPYLVTTLIYIWVAIHFWRTPTPSQASLRLHSGLIALGLVIHGGLLYQDIFIGDLNLNIANAVSLIFWLTVLIYWIADFKHQLHSLQALVLPPAAVTVLLQAQFHGNVVVSFANDPLFIAHIVIAMLAYSLFTFAALHAVLMAAADRALHKKTSLLNLA